MDIKFGLGWSRIPKEMVNANVSGVVTDIQPFEVKGSNLPKLCYWKDEEYFTIVSGISDTFLSKSDMLKSWTKA